MPINIDYIKFWLKASNSKGHGMHSPFVYDFIINVLNDDRVFYCFKELKEERNKLSKQQPLNSLKIDELLFRMVDYYVVENITLINANSITESYITNALNTNSSINSTNLFDINKQIKHLVFIDINGNTEVRLNNIIETSRPKSIIVINKNHNNAVQQNIWQNLVEDKRINTTIDLFYLGIAVINPDIKIKQHFSIRY